MTPELELRASYACSAPARPRSAATACFAELDRYVEARAAGRRGRRPHRPRHARPPARLHRLPRGARQPAGAARVRACQSRRKTRERDRDALSDRRRRHDRRRRLQGHPRRRTRTARSASSALSPTRRTSGRRSRRGSGRAATRRRSGAAPPSSASTCASGGRSSRSTSTRAARRDDAGRRATATSSCCSPPAAGRGSCPPATTATSSTSGRSTTTARARARRREGARFVVDRRRLHRLGDRGRARDERLQRHDGLPRAGIGARLFPAELSAFVTDYYREKGVEVLAGELVDGRRRRRRHDRRRTGDARGGRASSPGSGSSRRPSSPSAAGLRSTTGSSSTSSAGPAGAKTCSPPATSRGSRSPALGERDARRARGPREQPRPAGRREHGRRGQAVRPPAVLLLRPVRARLRGGRRGRLRLATRRGVDASRTARAYRLRGRRRRPRGFLLWDVWGKVDAARDLIRAGEPVDEADAWRPRLSQTSPSRAGGELAVAVGDPPAECVDQRTGTRRYRMSMSGWWFSASASSARRSTNAIAAGKQRELELPLEARRSTFGRP